MTPQQANQIINGMHALYANYYGNDVWPVSTPINQTFDSAFIQCFLYNRVQSYVGFLAGMPNHNSRWGDLTQQFYSEKTENAMLIKLEHPLQPNQSIQDYIIQNFIPQPLEFL